MLFGEALLFVFGRRAFFSAVSCSLRTATGRMNASPSASVTTARRLMPRSAAGWFPRSGWPAIAIGRQLGLGRFQVGRQMGFGQFDRRVGALSRLGDGGRFAFLQLFVQRS